MHTEGEVTEEGDITAVSIKALQMNRISRVRLRSEVKVIQRSKVKG